MPSKRDVCLMVKPDIQQQQHQQHQQQQQQQRDFLARDVEELVCEIKENLRLKARPRRSQQQQRPRPKPYTTERPPPPPQPAPPQDPQDPYEMLQQLLDTNCLVAEAVRRLREGICPKRHFLYEDDEENLLYPLSY